MGRHPPGSQLSREKAATSALPGFRRFSPKCPALPGREEPYCSISKVQGSQGFGIGKVIGISSPSAHTASSWRQKRRCTAWQGHKSGCPNCFGLIAICRNSGRDCQFPRLVLSWPLLQAVPAHSNKINTAYFIVIFILWFFSSNPFLEASS